MDANRAYHEKDLSAINSKRVVNAFNLKTIVSKFRDGNKRYLSNALDQRVMEALSNGADPIEIIDTLLVEINETHTRLNKIKEQF